MPPSILVIISLFMLIKRPRGDVFQGNIEADYESPCRKMVEILLLDVWIRQELGCGHNGAGNSPLHLGIVGDLKLYHNS